jgi:AraC-like DNA-binding protein
VKSNALIRELYRKMKNAIENPGSMASLKLKIYMLDILLQLTEPYMPSEIPESLLSELTRVKDTMIHSPELRRSNREWASELGVSESHFYRLFKETYGQSPASFAERHCIKQAEKWLLGTDTPIIDIAMNLGFKTSQHFATVFKKNTGVTPSAWRKNK